MTECRNDPDDLAPNATRRRYVSSCLAASAQELVENGFIGVAAHLQWPRGVPLVVTAGHRDLERSTALAGDELFATASQSKMFTAAIVLSLIAEGRVGVDDPVARYVDGVPAVDPAATIAHYLNHTSGIGNFIHALTALPHPWPTLRYEDILGIAALHGRQFSPGARLDYNNTDVVVLGRLCERVTGLPLRDLIAQRICGPLGMRDTHVADGTAWPREHVARGYYIPTHAASRDPVDVSRVADYSIGGAAANVVSTLPDLTKFLRHLLQPQNACPPPLASFAAGVAKARGFTPHWFLPRTYGRGLECWSWAGRPFWGHRGTFFGYHSASFVDPRTGLSFATFMTVCTEGSFMRYMDLQAHDMMAFVQSCAELGVAAAELA